MTYELYNDFWAHAPAHALKNGLNVSDPEVFRVAPGIGKFAILPNLEFF